MRLSKVLVIMIVFLTLMVSITSTARPLYYQQEMNQNSTDPGSRQQQETFSPIHGVWWSTDLWTPAVPPDSIRFFICWQDSDSTTHCIPLPLGVILLLPVPQD